MNTNQIIKMVLIDTSLGGMAKAVQMVRAAAAIDDESDISLSVVNERTTCSQ